jgi:hypothetical protein
VKQVARRAGAQHGDHAVGLDRLAAEQHVFARAKRRWHFVRDGVEQRRRQEDRAHLLLDDCRGEGARRDRHRLRNRRETRAVEQCAPEFERRGVEGGIRQLRHDVARPDLCAIGIADESQHRAMRHLDTLRHAGRPGRVDHVCRILGSRFVVGQRWRTRRELRFVARRTQHHRTVPGQAGADDFVGDRMTDLRVGQHEGNALARELGIDRHVRRARLQHREPRDRDIGGFAATDRNARVPDNAGGAQRVREAICGQLEFRIGERADGHSIGMRAGGFAETPMDRLRGGIRTRVRRNLREQRVARCVVHQRQRVHWHSWRGRHRGDDARVLPAHPLDRRAREKIAAILEPRGHAFAVFDQRQRKVELRMRNAGVDATRHGAGEDELVGIALAQREHDLEQRIARWIARRAERVDQLFERRVAVSEHRRYAIARAREKRRRVGAIAQIGAQDQRVREKADDLRRDRRAAAR